MTQESSHSSFVITGHGRSGTKFLSFVMNHSRRWTVLHEPAPKGLDAPIEEVQKRLDHDFYGEVNSYLRRIIFDLNVAKRGVILRDPCEVWVSIANRSPEPEWPLKLARLEESMNIVENAIEKGARLILFDKMTSDLTYLQETLDFFGIEDVNVNCMCLSPLNETREKTFSSVNDFPRWISHRVKAMSVQKRKYLER